MVIPFREAYAYLVLELTMFEAVLLLPPMSPRSAQKQVFFTLPTFDHIAVIDVVSFSDIPASWPTFLWSVSNQLLNDIYIEIAL
jgi:hypothetical protein